MAVDTGAVFDLEGGLAGGSLLGAAGLSSGLMLAWAAAAAIPILLHLLNRRRQQPISWAAMQLLLQVVEQQAKRMRVEQLVLLALRVLILLTLACGLARPFFNRLNPSQTTTGARPAKLWIVAIDTSYSMGYRSGGQSRMDAAKERAAQLLEGSQAGDAYSLIALSQPARAIIGTPTFDQQGMLGELQRIAVLDTGSDLVGGLALIEEIAQDASQLEGIPHDIHIALLSDLGRDAWQTAVDGNERSVLLGLQDKYLVEIESFAEAAPSNAAIKSISPATSRAIAGNSLQVDITVESTGANLEQLPVQLELDGQTVASAYVDLSAGLERVVRLEIFPKTTGLSILTASIPDDQLLADNRRNHIIEVRDQYRILIVENERGDARLLKLALQPVKRPLATQGIATMAKLDLVTANLADWDVVVLNDLENIGGNTAQQLRRFVRNGGSLIVLFGHHALAEAWNAVDDQPDSLLGFTLTEPTAEADWSIDPLDYRSPVVAPFAGFPDSGLLTTPIFRLWQIASGKPTKLTIDLATTDGQPLIVRHRLGSGWVASLLSAPQDGLAREATDLVWNAMATWPSFLPLMQQLVQTVLNTGVERSNVLTGEVLQGSVSEAVDRSRVTIVRPDGSESQLATEAPDSSGGLPWYYRQTETRGVYRARQSNQERPYAVNINPVESSLESLDVAQLPASNASQPQLDIASVAQPTENDDSVARLLLGCLFCLLVAESLLAWSLGRRIG